MNYTVKYKRADSFFWKTLKRVKADGILDTKSHRYFILDNETRIEIPLESMLFVFGKERFISIRVSMEKVSGQKMVVDAMN